MAYISGRWLFNSNIEWWGTLPTDTSLEVKFRVYNLEDYRGYEGCEIVFYNNTIDYKLKTGNIADGTYDTKLIQKVYGSFVDADKNGSLITVSRWADDVYRTIDFGAPQEISAEQLNLIKFNATLIEEYNPYYIISEKTLTNIADAIRNATGSTDKIKVKNMAAAIAGVSIVEEVEY